MGADNSHVLGIDIDIDTHTRLVRKSNQTNEDVPPAFTLDCYNDITLALRIPLLSILFPNTYKTPNSLVGAYWIRFK